MKHKKYFITYLILSISVISHAQIENDKYDTIPIRLNARINSPEMSIPIVKAISAYHQNHPEIIIDYKCVDSTSVPIFQAIITLTSGTYWDLYNPPKQPKFLFFKVLFKSNNKAFIDWIYYMQFLSISEAINDIPYDIIEKVNYKLTYWNFKNEINFKKIIVISDSEEKIIQAGGTKCISIEYEMVSNLVEQFKVVRSEIINHSKMACNTSE